MKAQQVLDLIKQGELIRDLRYERDRSDRNRWTELHQEMRAALIKAGQMVEDLAKPSDNQKANQPAPAYTRHSAVLATAIHDGQVSLSQTREQPAAGGGGGAARSKGETSMIHIHASQLVALGAWADRHNAALDEGESVTVSIRTPADPS